MNINDRRMFQTVNKNTPNTFTKNKTTFLKAPWKSATKHFTLFMNLGKTPKVQFCIYAKDNLIIEKSKFCKLFQRILYKCFLWNDENEPTI